MRSQNDTFKGTKYNPTPLGDVILPRRDGDGIQIYVHDPEWAAQKQQESDRIATERRLAEQEYIRERMNTAGALARSRRYADARKILITVNHPTAYKWLKRIDYLEEEQLAALRQRPLPPPAQVKLHNQTHSSNQVGDDNAKVLAHLFWIVIVIVNVIVWLAGRM